MTDCKHRFDLEATTFLAFESDTLALKDCVQIQPALIHWLLDGADHSADEDLKVHQEPLMWVIVDTCGKCDTARLNRLEPTDGLDLFDMTGGSVSQNEATR